jgi:hypothetical protein
MRCIFCLEERSPSEEHIFPRAIGGCLTTDRVCEPCNSMLGTSADAPLVEHPCILLRRSQLRIPGNSGRIPDAVGDFLREGVLVDDPTQKYRLTTDPITRMPLIKLLRGNEKEITLPDGSKAKQVAIDARDSNAARKTLRVILQRERGRHNLPPLSVTELESHIAAILSQGPEVTINPTIRTTVQIDGFGFSLGLLKIAYELAFRWLGDGYLDDPMAARIRGILRAPSREEAINAAQDIQSEMSFAYDNSNPNFLHWNNDAHAHVAYAGAINSNDIAIFVRIFNCVSGGVIVTDRGALYAEGRFDPKVIKFVHIDPANQVTREIPFLVEMGRLANMLLAM